MRISVIGSGYVGLVAAACFAELGHTVICVDNDHEKIASLNAGGTLIHEDYLQELLSRHRHNTLTFSTSIEDAVRESMAIFIAVGTPCGVDGGADLSYVESVAQGIATYGDLLPVSEFSLWAENLLFCFWFVPLAMASLNWALARAKQEGSLVKY